MIRLLVLSLALFVVGCAEPKNLSCKSAVKAKPSYDNEQAASVVGVIYARKLKKIAADADFGSGFGSHTMSRIAGTDAYSVLTLATQLRGMMADARAADFWIETNGSVTLQGNSTKMCETLAVSIANLDISQSDEQFIENVKEVETYFKNRFGRYGGINLDQMIAELQ